MTKTVKVIINIVLVIFIIFGALIAYSLLPIKNNYKLYAVLTGSMGKTIPIGSFVVVKPQKEYQINDIITYQPTNRKKSADTVTHRIIEKREENSKTIYFTKGDANAGPDAESIPAQSIVGRVLFHVPVLGYIITQVKTPYGVILIIVVPATIIIYEEIKKIKEEFVKIKKKKNKNDK